MHVIVVHAAFEEEVQSVQVHAEQATRAHRLVPAGSLGKKRPRAEEVVKCLFLFLSSQATEKGQLGNDD